MRASRSVGTKKIAVLCSSTPGALLHLRSNPAQFHAQNGREKPGTQTKTAWLNVSQAIYSWW
jgi:hypothetical protein